MATGTNITVVIDIGTSKLVALAGRKHGEEKYEILAKAKVPARGIKRGVVLNIDEAASAIKTLVEEVERQLGEEVVHVNVSYAGQPMKMFQYNITRETTGEGMVTQADVDELFNEAKCKEVDPGFRILHVIPQKFIIDGEMAESVPVGATGRTIDVTFQIIAVPEAILLNFERVMERAGLILEEVTLSPLVTGEAVLTEEEKEMGAVMVDIGAGTTKISVYHDSILIHAAVIPFGGDVVTRDIKEGCSILYKWAEQLKVQYGQALGDFADDRKVVTIPGHNGWEPKEISFKSLAFIIQARMEEIVESVGYQIENTGMAEQLGLGIVLAGGTAGMNNLVSLVKFKTGMDARLAHPVFRPMGMPKSNDSNDYLTALGLLKVIFAKNEPVPQPEKKKKKEKRRMNGFTRIMNAVQGVLDYVDDDDDVVLK